MKNMPMEVLRTFVTVFQIGSFTQAGELLGRSQPAISLQIKRLEDMLGQRLVIRNGQNIELTQSGRTLLGYAQKILALNDTALSTIDNDTISGKVRLGIPSEFATTFLPKVVGRFTQAHPNITLEVGFDLSVNLLSRAGRSKYDLILALHDSPDEVGYSQVKTDELVWVSNRELETYTGTTLPLIVAMEGCIYRNRAISRLNQQNVPWRIVYTNPDLSGIQAAIEEGLGITVLARSTVPKSLKIIKDVGNLPELGHIGISLVAMETNKAVELMSEYLRTSLA